MKRMISFAASPQSPLKFPCLVNEGNGMWFSNSTSDYVVLSSPHSFTIGNTRTFVCDQQIETDADERCLGHGLGVGATPVNFELRGSNMRKDNIPWLIGHTKKQLLCQHSHVINCFLSISKCEKRRTVATDLFVLMGFSLSSLRSNAT